MDIKFNNETMYQLGNLALSMHGKLDQDQLEPVATPCEPKPPPGMDAELAEVENAGDHLFSEIHLNELKKLEKQLETTEAERLSLSNKFKESQSSIDQLKDDLAAELAHTSQVEAHMTTFLNSNSNLDSEVVQLLRASLK